MWRGVVSTFTATSTPQQLRLCLSLSILFPLEKYRCGIYSLSLHEWKHPNYFWKLVYFQEINYISKKNPCCQGIVAIGLWSSLIIRWDPLLIVDFPKFSQATIFKKKLQTAWAPLNAYTHLTLWYFIHPIDVGIKLQTKLIYEFFGVFRINRDLFVIY